MTRWDELRAVGHAARQLPAAVLRRGCASVHTITDDNLRCPVVLVHGYAGSETVWTPLREALADAGFGHLISLNYNSFATEPMAVAEELVRQVDLAGAPGVHLVGHSLGGLIVRHASTHPGLADLMATAVTIATPHRGAPLARIAPGPCARMIHHRDRVSVLPPRRMRWLAYYSDGDRVVPTSSARLDDLGYAAKNILIPGCGHLTICRDPRLIRSLIAELSASDIGVEAQSLVAA